MNFWEKEEGSLQSEKFVAKKCNIVFRNEGGGVRGRLEVYPKLSTESSLPRKYLGIAQIAIAPPAPHSNGTLGHFISEKSGPNNPGKGLDPPKSSKFFLKVASKYYLEQV